MCIKLESTILIAAIFLSACVTNLASKVDLSETDFIVGQTTKKDVVTRLGLPEKTIRGEDGTEQYFYAGAARLTGFTVGSAGGGVYSTGPGLLDAAISESMVGDGAVYKFDKNGLLIIENSPKTRAKKTIDQ